MLRELRQHVGYELHYAQSPALVREATAEERGYQLLCDPAVNSVIVKLKEELDTGRIAPVRANVSLHADVRIRDLCIQHVMVRRRQRWQRWQRPTALSVVTLLLF